MNKKIKIILGLFGLLILVLVAFVAMGLYGMEIEDTYGDNQDIFYNSRQGDIVVNHEAKEFGEIKKTWKRFYVTYKSDTVDIGDWWDDKNIEVYKRTDSETSQETFTYSEIGRLTGEGKLKLKRKLR
jgi:hypothetical protein